MLIIACYLLVGSVAGFSAGLFGTGGGLVFVPALIYGFSVQGLSPDVATHLAIGTSLACIVVTSINSIRTHQEKKAIRWDVFMFFSIGTIVGSWLGGYTTSLLSGPTLKLLIGVFALLMAIKMWFSVARVNAENKKINKAVVSIVGTVIGWVCSLFGIGGGMMTVPFLSSYGLKMTQAIATSAAISFPIAFIGVLSSIYYGMGHASLPDHSVGYVYLPAFLGIVATSVIFSRFGAKMTHNLQTDKLKKCFAVFLVCVGIDLISSAF